MYCLIRSDSPFCLVGWCSLSYIRSLWHKRLLFNNRLYTFLQLLPPANEVCKGNVYRPQRSCSKVMFSQASVILFTGGGVRGGGVHGRRACVAGGCAWQGGMHGRGGHCSGRYASYRNAFLLGEIIPGHNKSNM